MSAVDVVYQGLTIARGASLRTEGEQLFIEMNAPMPVATRLLVLHPTNRMEGRVIRVHEGVGAGVTVAPAGDEPLPAWIKALRPEPVQTVELEADPEVAAEPSVPVDVAVGLASAQPEPAPAPAKGEVIAVTVQAAPVQAAPQILRALPMEPTTLSLSIPDLDALPPLEAPPAAPVEAPAEAPPVAAAAAPAASATTPPPAGTPAVQTPPYEATLEMAIPSLDDEDAPREDRRGGSKKPKKPARRR